MRASRSSYSFAQSRDTNDNQHNRKARARSSLDTFLIPGRTRLPSSKPKVPDEFDLRTTQSLFNLEAIQIRYKPLARTISQRIMASNSEAPLFHRRESSGTDTLLPGGFDGPNDSTDQSRVTSTTWSTVSHRIFTDSSGSSNHRETSGFFEEYNRLAMKHGLPQFARGTEAESRAPNVPEEVKITSRPQQGWLLRKLLRKSSSSYSVKIKSTKSLSRKLSTASMPDRGRKDTLKDKSLEEIARLGGVSILILPLEFAAAKLAIPTCISASGTYILQHGRTSSGIFRVPGQLSTVNALYDYYAHQFEIGKSISGLVEETVGSGLLPTHIAHNVHDVASVFKKFLAGLPGGILGSLSLFTALRSIKDHLYPSPDLTDNHQQKVRGRLIALAISCVTSEFRISLICAVLGLVALIGAYAEAKIKGESLAAQPPPATDLMGYEALGLVLGPLLVGELTDEIELGPGSERGGLLNVPISPEKRRKDKRKTSVTKSSDKNVILAMHVERARVSASVMEMLLINWKGVVPQLRNIGAMEGHCTIQEKRRKIATEDSRYSLNVLEDRLRSQPSADWEGSLKVKKKVTIRTSSPNVFGGNRSNDTHANVRIHSRESLKIGMRAWKQRSSQHLSGSIPTTPTKMKKGDLPMEQTDLFDYAAAAAESAAVAARRDGHQASGDVDSDLLEPEIAPLERHNAKGVPLDREVTLVEDPEELRKHVENPLTSLGTTKVSERSGQLNNSGDDHSFSEVNDQDAKHEVDKSDKDTGHEQEVMVYYRELDSDNLGVLTPTDGQVKSEVMEQSLTPAIYPFSKTIPACIGSEAVGLDSLGLASPAAAQDSYSSPKVENVEGTKPLGVTRHGGVKQMAQSIGKPRERTRSNEEIQRGIDARASALARQYSVKEAAQMFDQVKTTKDSYARVSKMAAISTSPDFTEIGDNVDAQKVETTPSRTGSPTKASLIPKPIDSRGQSRKSSPTRITSKAQKTALVSNVLPNESVPIRVSSRSASPSKFVIPPTVMPDTMRRFRSYNGLPELPSELFQRSVSSSAEQLRRMLPHPEEPPVAQHLHFRVSGDRLSSNSASSQRQLSDTSSKQITSRNATLYAEIRRLQRQLGQRSEETMQAQKELEAVRDYREAGTLSEKLREAQREAKTWKNRAEWAEKRLLALEAEKRVTMAGGAGESQKRSEDIAV